MMDESATLAADKSLVVVEGGLHDLLANKLGLVTTAMIEWIQRRQQSGYSGATVTERDDMDTCGPDGGAQREGEIEPTCFGGSGV